MSIKINHELPVPEVLKNEYPLSNEQKSIKQQRDEEIRRIFTGESDKFVVLVGPCSADNEDTVCEYVNRLKKVSDKVSDKLMIIHEYIQTSLELPVMATRECSISRIRIRHRISLPESLQSAKCISAYFRKPVFLLQMNALSGKSQLPG